MTATPPKRRLFVRLARILLLGTVTLMVLVCLAIAVSAWYIETKFIAKPPAAGVNAPVPALSVSEAGGVRTFGNAWLAKRDGILRMYLTGDPFTLGYSNAVLTQEYVKTQEASLIALVRTHVPSAWKFWLLRKYVIVRNKDLPSYVKEDHQVEIYGLSRAYRDPFPELGSLYHRLLNYHAAHDISHAVMDHPLVGCTSFAAKGARTRDGHLMIGRNFDFDAGKCFDENKIVMRVKPDRGLGFISVGWPGLVGVVTAINDAKVAISVNAAQSSDTRQIGTPVSLMMREVMQYASSLEQAVDIIRGTQVFVSDCYLVADGKTGEAAIVEKTPARTAVVNMDGDSLIGSNHFVSDALKDDPANLKYMREGTSVVRYDRMKALVESAASGLDAPLAAAILRDRAVPGSAAGGYGNPASLNPLVATHSVIMDVTAGVIWVSAFPHQLGSYVPFSIDSFDAPGGVPAVDADGMLADGSFARYEASTELISLSLALLARNKLAEARAAASQAEALNPDFYVPHMLLGQIALAGRDWASAEAHFRRTVEHYPAYESERVLIDNALAQIAAERKARPQ